MYSVAVCLVLPRSEAKSLLGWSLRVYLQDMAKHGPSVVHHLLGQWCTSAHSVECLVRNQAVGPVVPGNSLYAFPVTGTC